MTTRDSLASCPPSVSAEPTDAGARSAVWSTALVGLLVGVLVELLPRVGGDLVAQQWWASWAASSGGQPVDLGWYAGSPAVSYSLLAPWVLTLVGPALAGVVSTAVGAAATTALLLRAGTVRPRLTGLAAVTAFAADQLSGRTTFAMGTATGLLALLVIGGRLRPTQRRPSPHSPSPRRLSLGPLRGNPVARRSAAALLTALAGALSPVSAVFLALAAVAWWLAGATRSPAGSPPMSSQLTRRTTLLSRRPPGRTADVAVLLLSAAAPLAAMVGLGAAGGPMTSSAHQMLAAVLAAIAVFAVLGPEQRLLRTGALLTVLALVASWLITDPMGSNTTRLVLLFALPVLIGTARRSLALALLTAALVVWLLPPLVPRDLMPRDTTTFQAATAPMLGELAGRGPVGRVEVVPLASHQDALLADQVPLARGWTRQLDVARNPLFYDGTLDAAGYLDWLRERGVSYVALADERLDWVARGEAALVRAGVPGLTRVWSDAHWSLYAVDGPGIVDGPATLVSSDRRALTLDVTGAGTVAVALFWNARLTVSGAACIAPGDDGTVLVRATGPGPVVLSSAWRPRGHCAD